MLKFAPPDPTLSSSHVEYEGSTIKIDELAAQLSSTASAGIGMFGDLSSSDSIYPSNLTQSQNHYSYCNNSLGVDMQKKPFRRRRLPKSLDTKLNTIGPSNTTREEPPITSLPGPVVLLTDPVAASESRPSKHALLTSPNDSVSETNSVTSSVRCYKDDDSITALQSEFFDTVPLLLQDTPLTDALAPSPPNKSSRTYQPPLSARSGQKISFAGSFTAMFGDKSKIDIRSVPPASLNSTTVTIPKGPTSTQLLPRSKSTVQLTNSESVQKSIQQPTHLKKTTPSRKESIPITTPGQGVKWDSAAIAAELTDINSGFLHNAITTSMHAMGVESRQELVALQNIVDTQAKLIAELTARIKVLEARQHISAEKIAKMNKTVNVFNPELVLRVIKYQKELDGTLKAITKKQELLSEDNPRRLHDLRELVADLPTILARLTTLEKEILASKDMVEKLKQEVLK
ncbi:Hypothetical protein GLP15_1273 [Giardia lamblia P15]|uniref:Uncharacterized protein n=1 Tax=Giardia intestinalis (strain P15) TaxID=658858 RepID=E1EZP0_GIAIA|nr:Hypothetical protein GLP15_1273 [Giardia lamblia P15]